MAYSIDPVGNGFVARSPIRHVMNNFSLLADNRLTHLKVVMLALACVTLVVGFGLAATAPGMSP